MAMLSCGIVAIQVVIAAPLCQASRRTRLLPRRINIFLAQPLRWNFNVE
jgi:hypothetical protein